MFGLTGKTAVEAAEETLGKIERARAALLRETEALGQGPIEAMLAADRELRDTEVAAALDEAPQAAVAKAKKRAAECRAAVEEAVNRLEGLRRRIVVSIGTELPGRLEALNQELPEHIAAAQRAFREEWSRGAAEYSRLLAKRAALESLLGPLGLPDAAPGALPELGEIARPFKRLEEIRSLIAGVGVTYEPMRPEPNAPRIGQLEVFVLAREVRGVPAGTKVVEGCFPANVLANLVYCDWAAPLPDTERERAVFDATRARLQMEAADHEKMLQEFEANAQAEAAERKRRREKQYGPDEKIPRTSHSNNPVARMVDATDPEREAIERAIGN